MPEIRLIKEGRLAWLVIDHPERLNALTPEMMAQLSEGLTTIQQDRDIRAVVLTGAGNRAFASGGDISRFDQTRKDFSATQAAEITRRAIFNRMSDLDRPVIAMIRGYCMGGGLALALQADLRFAASDAAFAIPAARLGIAYGLEGIGKLASLVGPSVAKDILFSARRVKAEEALGLGLINRVVAPADLEDVTRAYCSTLVKNAPLSIAATKYFTGQVALTEAARDHATIEAMARRAAESEDIKEGRRAFMEKREPDFKGA